jgi:hypothetical protein
MPRSPEIVARQKLAASLANFERADKARSRARVALYEAMVKAVEVGVTRYEVAKLANVSQARVGQIPGMPKGKNARKVEAE